MAHIFRSILSFIFIYNSLELSQNSSYEQTKADETAVLNVESWTVLQYSTLFETYHWYYSAMEMIAYCNDKFWASMSILSSAVCELLLVFTIICFH